MKAKVALSKDFLESYSKLPKKHQKKVREFTEKFQKDPTQPGINFERLGGSVDDKVRSVRIDQAYRAIVIHPPKGDVFLCVWVDHHDDAYRWAENKRFEVNPRSGSLQLFEAVEGGQVSAAAAAGAHSGAPLLFDELDDEDLIFAGVPLPLLETVRSLQSDQDLDKLAPFLPEEAAEMLTYMAAGCSLTEALEETARDDQTGEAAIDVEDFEAALAKAGSKRQFRIPEDEEELQTMLDAPLEQWRIFLHPSQREIVEVDADGPVRVLGGAGTGKTVVLMHRANHLLKNVFTDPDDRILVTTFTKNLAHDLATNLKNLCGDDFERLEVKHLDSWASGFLHRQGIKLVPVSNKKRVEFFDIAIDESGADQYPPNFFTDEWSRVVQAQDVDSRDAYLSARRVGRGTKLSRPERVKVWEVFARFRELLDENNFVEYLDIIREARLFIEKQNLELPYRAVLVDEVQDFAPNALKLLAAIAPKSRNSLFLVGDAHQRIYGFPTSLSHCGIEVGGRVRRLQLNYRTTAEIRRSAERVLESHEVDDLDLGTDTLKYDFSMRYGPEPEFRHFERETDEAEFIVGRIKAWLEAGVPDDSICLATRTNSQLKARYKAILAAAEISAVYVERTPASERGPGVRLATMHRMKGLEFSRVLLAGVQDGMMPLLSEHTEAADVAGREDWELKERCLFYVAQSRARDGLAVTGFGSPSRLAEPRS